MTHRGQIDVTLSVYWIYTTTVSTSAKRTLSISLFFWWSSWSRLVPPPRPSASSSSSSFFIYIFIWFSCARVWSEYLPNKIGHRLYIDPTKSSSHPFLLLFSQTTNNTYIRRSIKWNENQSTVYDFEIHIEHYCCCFCCYCVHLIISSFRFPIRKEIGIQQSVSVNAATRSKSRSRSTARRSKQMQSFSLHLYYC